MDQDSETLTAREAARRLGVKLPTLYAYASRGQLRSVPGPRGRQRRYLRADVERLRARTGGRRPRVERALSDALRSGEPLLESTITRLEPAGPLYRGHAALDLAAAGTPYEVVAELLWTGEAPDEPADWRCDGLGLPTRALSTLIGDVSPTGPFDVLSLLVPALGVRDAGRFDLRAEAVRARARPLIRRMTAGFALEGGADRLRASLHAESVAAALLVALGGRADDERVAAVDRTLVLIADHELNASAFAARVVASTRADPYAAIAAAIGALSGPRHGAASERFAALVAETEAPEQAANAIHERFRRGETVAGFGHRIYTEQDPRAAMMLDLARSLAPRDPTVRTVLALCEAMEDAGRPPANADVGLVAMSAAVGLPLGRAPVLFAIGRAAGWIAHVIEQYEADFLVRPRARHPEEG